MNSPKTDKSTLIGEHRSFVTRFRDAAMKYRRMSDSWALAIITGLWIVEVVTATVTVYEATIPSSTYRAHVMGGMIAWFVSAVVFHVVLVCAHNMKWFVPFHMVPLLCPCRRQCCAAGDGGFLVLDESVENPVFFHSQAEGVFTTEG